LRDKLGENADVFEGTLGVGEPHKAIEKVDLTALPGMVVAYNKCTKKPDVR